MTNLIRIIAAVALIGTLGIVSFPQASAGGPVIEQAQRDGLVGERVDGYLGLVDQSADESIKRRVNEVNAQRRTVYDQLARREGVPDQTVARLTGEKQIARSPSGSFVMREDGVWTRK